VNLVFGIVDTVHRVVAMENATTQKIVPIVYWIVDTVTGVVMATAQR